MRPENSGTPTIDPSEEIAQQIDSIVDGIVKKHPRLKAARDAAQKRDEPSDKFAREFLQVFRQRLQGE